VVGKSSDRKIGSHGVKKTSTEQSRRDAMRGGAVRAAVAEAKRRSKLHAEAQLDVAGGTATVADYRSLDEIQAERTRQEGLLQSCVEDVWAMLSEQETVSA
jgi:hypothetical protein